MVRSEKYKMSSIKKYRWKIMILAFFAVIITYLDRSALSYAIKPLEETFNLTNEDFGIIASAFGIGYLIMTVIGGVLVDNFGARKIWSLSAFFWSLVCAAIGLCSGFISLLTLRLFLGIAEGPSFPALTRVVADWMPVSERARALALGLVAVPFASVVGAPFISWLITVFNWRITFVILGSFGVVWALIWYILFRDHPSQSKYTSDEERLYIKNNLTLPTQSPSVVSSQKTTWTFLLFNRDLLVNNYAFFTFGYVLFFAITWLPGYLEQTYHVDLKQTGLYLMLPWITASVLLILGGFLSDWIWNKTHSIRLARSHMIWVCQLLSAISFIPAIFAHSLPMAIFGISFGVGFSLMPNAAFYAINADVARDRAGTSLGIMDCAFAIAGILAPFLTGLLNSATGDFSSAIALMVILTLSSAFSIILWQKFE